MSGGLAPRLALTLGAPFLLFFVSFAVMGVSSQTVSSEASVEWLTFLGVFYLGTVPVGVLCLKPGVYLAVSIAGLAASLATLKARAPAQGWRIIAALSLLAIAAFPFVYRYTPALNAAPGYQLLWVTEPNLLESVTKRAQITLEQRPCTYTLLGWSAEALYYQAACTDGHRVWRYQPGLGRGAEAIGDAPQDLWRLERPALELVRAGGVQPAHFEPDTRAIHLRGKGLASQDGRYVAIVAQHIYGPEDVLVLTPTGP